MRNQPPSFFITFTKFLKALTLKIYTLIKSVEISHYSMRLKMGYPPAREASREVANLIE